MAENMRGTNAFVPIDQLRGIRARVVNNNEMMGNKLEFLIESNSKKVNQT